MGYSIVERAIDPKLIDSSYSVAFYGESNRLNFYKLKMLLNNQFPKPKYIALPCDIITYIKNIHYEYTNKPFYYSITPFDEIKYLQKNKLTSYYDYIKIKIFPYIFWKQAVGLNNLNRFKKSKNKYSNVSAKKKAEDINRFLSKTQLEKGSDYLYYPQAISYLEQTISLCKKNSIKLIFIKYPLNREFLNKIRLTVSDSVFYNRPSEALIKKNNIPILDFEKLYFGKDNYFFDTHHLNEDGKNTFSKMLKLKLDSLYKIY